MFTRKRKKGNESDFTLPEIVKKRQIVRILSPFLRGKLNEQQTQEEKKGKDVSMSTSISSPE